MKDIIFLLAFLLVTSFGHATSTYNFQMTEKAYSENGYFRAKSVPTPNLYNRSNGEAKTYVYLLGSAIKDYKDKLLDEYDWYSPEIYLHGLNELEYVLVRVGIRKFYNDEKVVIGFYKNGMILNEYGFEDLKEYGVLIKNKRTITPEFKLFNKVIGILCDQGPCVFKVVMANNDELLFNLQDGKLVTNNE